MEKQLLASAQAAAVSALGEALERVSASAGQTGHGASDAFRSAFLAAAARERARREVDALVRARLASAEAQASLRLAGRREAAVLSAGGIAPRDYSALAAAQAVAQRRERSAAPFMAQRPDEAERALALTYAAAEGLEATPAALEGDAADSVAAAFDAAMYITHSDRRTLQTCLEYVLGHTAVFAPDDLDVLDRALRDTAPGGLLPGGGRGGSDDHGMQREQAGPFAGFVAGALRGPAAAARAAAMRLAREYAAALDEELRDNERRTVCALIADAVADWRAADAAGDAAVAAAAAAPRRCAGDVAACVRDAKMRVLFPQAPWPQRVSAAAAAEAAAAAAAAEVAAQRRRWAVAPAGGAGSRGVPGLSRFGLAPRCVPPAGGIASHRVWRLTLPVSAPQCGAAQRCGCCSSDAPRRRAASAPRAAAPAATGVARQVGRRRRPVGLGRRPGCPWRASGGTHPRGAAVATRV